MLYRVYVLKFGYRLVSEDTLSKEAADELIGKLEVNGLACGKIEAS